MAPKRGQSIEASEERDEFIKKLAEFHEQRGTTFEPEPKVGVRHVDLYKLYQRVIGEGGYDLCSDTKAKPLMWRRFAEEFVGKNQYTAAQAFQVKNTYYKNLVSYEIKTHWGKEPPPKEIVEDVTAKGGAVMSRTLENYEKPAPKEQTDLQNGDGSDASPEQKTPKAEAAEDGDGPGSATGGRTTRGLRQQPPQRVLFQPDLTAGRQTRGAHGGPQPSPTPGAAVNGVTHSSSMTNGANTTLASYEPSQSYPLSLKPVITPGNNPEYYRNERKRKLEGSAGELARKYRNIMLPGTGFIGPNIYVRAQLALQSGIPEEESFALHHLVKISHERGDKYKFDQFPGLAEALMKKALQISSLFYDVDWDVAYNDDSYYMDSDDETLNGIGGTSNVLEKLKSRLPVAFTDSVDDAGTLLKRQHITEAALIIRNMCMLDHNAQCLATQPLVRDYVTIALSLPHTETTVELKHYALETSEQILKHSNIGSRDALYQILLEQLNSTDRGTITVALRTISRIGDKLPMPKLLEDVPDTLLLRIVDWLLVDDEELCSACLDFLSSYTSFGINVANLLNTIDAESLARHLTGLLLFDAKEHKTPRSVPNKHRAEDLDATPAPAPRLSHDIVKDLLLLDEPARSSEWLRMCFASDPTAEMTQISLWQAYQGTFAPYQATHPHLIAGDFIKNVSTTFTGATAQVAGANKYVIKGIRSRKVAVNAGLLPGTTASEKGRELHCCKWGVTLTVEPHRDMATGAWVEASTRDVECNEWFRSGTSMLSHVLSQHLHIPKTKPRTTPTPQTADAMDVDGTAESVDSDHYDWRSADKTIHRCRWANCMRSSADFDVGNPNNMITNSDHNDLTGTAANIESTSEVEAAVSKTDTMSLVSRTLLLARHIQTHIPSDPSTSISKRSKSSNITPTNKAAPLEGSTTTYTTLTDDVGDAAGVPLGAAIVLRNIARFFPTADALAEGSAFKGAVNGANSGSAGKDARLERLAEVYGGEVRDGVFFALAANSVLRREVDSVIRAVGRVERG